MTGLPFVFNFPTKTESPIEKYGDVIYEQTLNYKHRRILSLFLLNNIQALSASTFIETLTAAQ